MGKLNKGAFIWYNSSFINKYSQLIIIWYWSPEKFEQSSSTLQRKILPAEDDTVNANRFWDIANNIDFYQKYANQLLTSNQQITFAYRDGVYFRNKTRYKALNMVRKKMGFRILRFVSLSFIYTGVLHPGGLLLQLQIIRSNEHLTNIIVPLFWE